MIKATGILFLTPDKKVLLLKRRKTASKGANQWAFPAGHIEEGEAHEDAARREAKEELDIDYTGKLVYWTRRVDDDVDFVTFLARIPEEFTPTIDWEHQDWAWVNYKEALYGDEYHLHPGAEIALRRIDMDELDVAEAIRDDELASPQPYENIWLFNLRITGTGKSYRPDRDEYVWRDPSIYLTDRFVRRCNGLIVILEHPKGKYAIDTEEFRDRIIGTILLPYIKHDIEEVWGIGKVYDETAAEIMLEGEISTSPAVVFRDQTVNETLEVDGKKVFVEGNPSLLDHLAVCERGVWDKGGDPTGVEVSHLKE